MSTQKDNGFKINLYLLYKKEEERFCKLEEEVLSSQLLVLL
jgi:hypothetical protein